MARVVVLFSGGIDSTTVVYHLAKRTGHFIFPMYFYYGQKSGGHETVAKDEVINHLAPEHRVRIKQTNIVDISQSGIFKSSLTDHNTEVPQGALMSEQQQSDLTFVPFRNVIFISMAAAYAYKVKASEIYTGTFNAGDGGVVHSDATPQIESKLAELVDIVSDHTVKLVSPFLDMYKTEIFQMAKRLDVPFEKTWTCYNGGAAVLQCGVCPSCRFRRKIFLEAGVEDKTKYAN